MSTTRSYPLLTSASTATGVLREVKRLRNSIDGNARFRLGLEISGSGALVWWATRANAAVAGTVENFRLGTTVTLAINGHGSIIDMIEADEEEGLTERYLVTVDHSTSPSSWGVIDTSTETIRGSGMQVSDAEVLADHLNNEDDR